MLDKNRNVSNVKLEDWYYLGNYAELIKVLLRHDLPEEYLDYSYRTVKLINNGYVKEWIDWLTKKHKINVVNSAIEMNDYDRLFVEFIVEMSKDEYDKLYEEFRNKGVSKNEK